MDADRFQRVLGSFGVDWSLLFVEASIDAVSDAYARFRKGAIERDVQVHLTESDSGWHAPRGVVVQPAGSRWVIVFHEWSRYAEFPILPGMGMTARILEFGGSDGGLARTCNLFAPRGPIVRYQSHGAAREEDEHLVASGTKGRTSNITSVDSYQTVFRQYGIRLAFVGIDERRQVLMRTSDQAEIVRVDVAVAS